MSHRLHVANLRAAAAARGDTTDYQIMKRSGLSKSLFYRLIGQHATPSVPALARFLPHYDLRYDDLITEIDDTEPAAA